MNGHVAKSHRMFCVSVLRALPGFSLNSTNRTNIEQGNSTSDQPRCALPYGPGGQGRKSTCSKPRQKHPCRSLWRVWGFVVTSGSGTDSPRVLQLAQRFHDAGNRVDSTVNCGHQWPAFARCIFVVGGFVSLVLMLLALRNNTFRMVSDT